jgi:hypothetical protein
MKRRGTVEKQLKEIIKRHWPTWGGVYKKDGHNHHPNEYEINLLTHELYDNLDKILK